MDSSFQESGIRIGDALISHDDSGLEVTVRLKPANSERSTDTNTNSEATITDFRNSTPLPKILI